MKRKRRICPTMSLRSLKCCGDVEGCPSFFSYVVDERLAACTELDPCTPGHVSPAVQALAKKGVGGAIVVTGTEREGAEEGTRTEIGGLACYVISNSNGVCLTDPVLGESLKFIREINRTGKSVVVSAPSLNSTGSLLAAYLIISERKQASEAVQLVRDRRPGAMHSLEKTPQQITYLLSLEWHCAVKEALLLIFAWRHLHNHAYQDLLLHSISYILPNKTSPRMEPSEVLLFRGGGG
eukprot:TRINITY_DN48892_c0_g1_i1.p1 TRINITY_DN48892_c0_g1~~TRINITY_DN48892_c0_g1_i1.p1  ORF type:complete len:238 (+),score=20.65 TRINITY_DN48892_c0_g1_i1:103-816(+)